jgi:hypothetical protein
MRHKVRQRARTDRNQQAIMHDLRKAGCAVEDLSKLSGGCPDLLVGTRGLNFLFEVKDPEQPLSKQRLTADEQEWHRIWQASGGQVHIITSAQDALTVITTRGKQ